MIRQSLSFLAFGILTSPVLAVTPQKPAQTTSKATSVIPERREFPVNSEISPCQDFYAYACSKAIESFALRPDRSDHTFAFNDSAERLLEKKKSYLKEISSQAKQGETLPPRSQTLATIYNSCMDADARAAEEKSRVAAALKKMDAIKDRGAFAQFLAAERMAARLNNSQWGHLANQEQPDTYDFYFDISTMTLPERSYYENPEVRKEFKKVLTQFFTTIGYPKPTQVADAVLNYETAFAKVYPLPEQWREIWVQKREISRTDLVKLYPSLHMEQVLPLIPETTKIRHFTPETYAFVEDRMQKENLDTLKAVYLFENLANEMDDGYPAFKKVYHDFEAKELGAPKVRPSRDERCTKLTMNTFEKELDAELLPKVFPSFPEDKFIALAENVRQSIISGIQNNQWLSEEGKAGAKLKMEKAKLQLVKPRTEAEWHFNPEAQYSAVEPIANLEKLQAKLQERMFAELKKKRDSSIWEMGPLTVNAYYSPDDNKFVMPIGILQPPFYDPNLPLETNLGSVGAVIGHELGHGIDDQGSQFDADGRLKQWMNDKDVANFKSRGQNFEQQFNKIGHNGKLTLGENIGDLTGVTFAYRAAFPEGKGTQEAKQAFFLQYARVWCGVMLPKQKEMRLKTDPHSLGWARVNQQMKNQPEFAKAFQCNTRDAMVLPEKDVIKIW